MARILDLDPGTYARHMVHGEGRIWAETNCYTDVVLEMLHGMGHEPVAALPFTLTIDFDVDQWTFFKFRHADLEALYGLQIHELAPWRPLAWHVHEQVAAGRLVLVELDSYFLPDTAGTAYELAHVKSTVAVNAIDLDQERLGYFHNQGYHELSGEDFARLAPTASKTALWTEKTRLKQALLEETRRSLESRFASRSDSPITLHQPSAFNRRHCLHHPCMLITSRGIHCMSVSPMLIN